MTSKIKVDNINKVSDDSNIINKCGTTITLGASGDSISLAAGASQTGFGRTGTVDWDTTAKTASFTAVSGDGYFVNTTSGAVTMTLPASPSAGDIVSAKDYAYTFATNNLTVARNGSPIGGGTGDNPIYATNGTALTFIYVDGTKGWLVTNESTDTSQAISPAYITATGGTVTCCGDYKIHTFTGPGTFTVSCAGNAAGSNSVDYLVVAGGGGGGTGAGATDGGGGGGAGGFREGYNPGSYTASPLATTALPVTATAFPITVGGGGAGSGPWAGSCKGSNGLNSIFSTITSAGGGGGGSATGPVAPSRTGADGGSGGGGAGGTSCGTAITAGAGNTPPVSPSQGNPGGPGGAGNSPDRTAGGGGGATAAGVTATPSLSGPGGDGATTSITGSPVVYAGGGGAAGGVPGPGAGGAGGAGGGGAGSVTPSSNNGTAGTTNTGGGGGSSNNETGGAGGSGIVVIRYKFQ